MIESNLDRKFMRKRMKKTSIIIILFFIFSIFSGFISNNVKSKEVEESKIYATEDSEVVIPNGELDEHSPSLNDEILLVVNGTLWYTPHDPILQGYKSFKIDPPNSGRYTNGSLDVTISVSEDNTLNWQSNILIYSIYVKGGNIDTDNGKALGYVYNYDDGALSDTGLHAISKNGKYQDISHITFYYKEQQQPPVKGTINVEKKLIDEKGNIINGDGTEFSIKLTGPEEMKADRKLKAGDTISFAELPLGSYTISEENVPEEYELVSIEESEVNLTADNKEVKVIITNKKKSVIPPPVKGKINVEKKLVDEKGNIINGDGTEFSIKLTGPEEMKADRKLKAGDTISFAELPLGSYTISEENVPEGYELVGIEKSEVNLTADNKEVKVIITNKKKSVIPPPVKGTINVEKKLIDEKGNIINGDGTEFSIKLTGPEEMKADRKLKAGDTISFAELPLGSYTISEENVPEEYELVSIEESEVDLTADNKEVKVIITNKKKSVIPPPVKGKINVEKKLVDEKGNIINGDGTEFSIKLTGPEEMKAERKFKAGDTMSFAELPLGSYTISEENVPVGYELVSIEKSEVDLTADSKEVKVIITNKKKSVIPPPVKGKINVEKKLVDEKGNIINGDGTEFTIKLIGPEEMKAERKFKAGDTMSFAELPLGFSYIIAETSIPRGYELVSIDKSEVALSADNSEVKVIVTNRKKPTTPPSNGGGVGGSSISYGSIGDYVWLDENEDGKQDVNEKGISGVKVILTKSDGTKIQTFTDSSGKYTFNNLLSGKYIVTIDDTTLPKGLKGTYELDGIFDHAVIVELKSGEVKNNVDFGYVKIKEETTDKPEDNEKVEEDKKTVDTKPVDTKPSKGKIPQTGTKNFNLLLLGALTSIISGIYIVLSKKKEHIV